MIIYIDRFYQYLESLCDTYGKLSALLGRKIQAVQDDDIETLDRIIREEQPYEMKLRGFDQNIAKYRMHLGVHSETLRGIIDELPDEQQGRFSLLYTRLRSVTDEARALNDKCQKLTEVRLHQINKGMQELHRAGAAPPPAEKPKDDEAKPKLFRSV